MAIRSDEGSGNVEKNRVWFVLGACGALSLILAGVYFAGRSVAADADRRVLEGEFGRLAADLSGLGDELRDYEEARRESVLQLAGAVEKLEGNVAAAGDALGLVRENREDIVRLGHELAEARGILDGLAGGFVRDQERLALGIRDVAEIGRIDSENEELARRGSERVREVAERCGINLPEAED